MINFGDMFQGLAQSQPKTYVRVVMKNGVVISGRLVGTDEHLGLVLEDT
jgi:small nuclear ribonucleoprotein (snRNP)-like protein